VLDTLRSPYLTFTCKGLELSDAKDAVAMPHVRAAKIVAARMRETLVEVFIVVSWIVDWVAGCWQIGCPFLLPHSYRHGPGAKADIGP
jgi:hypothetical protein